MKSTSKRQMNEFKKQIWIFNTSIEAVSIRKKKSRNESKKLKCLETNDPNTGLKSNNGMTPKALAEHHQERIGSRTTSSRITSGSDQHYQNSDTRKTMGCNQGSIH